ncbi:metal-dependent hydrolase [Ureibacillus aquaedulcis]|uniref:Metal-dependent hydrolase n=1 Tax=Ureibacillus aquaedulcis TaxID=3058421 RepID=A0ABT8GKL3_9BACL|nr:metal-dependent hydrolase [Ureibacillus sp. BA0131]MDN4491952.1 metal-dependent hydrolase [Ureibacillus sp. BA0131]
MNKPAHLMGGLTAGIAASKYIIPIVSHNGLVDGMVSIGAVICGALLGSLLPDIDHRNSYIGRKLKIASFIISKTLGHRSVVHTPLVIFAFSALLFSFSNGLTGPVQDLSNSFVIGLSSGMWSHLLLDMMTKRGIPLLYPLTKKSFRIAAFKGGGIGDTIAITGCTILIFFILLDFAGIYSI